MDGENVHGLLFFHPWLQNDYAAVTVISQDDRPISQSGDILVQIGTTAHPKGRQVRKTKVKQKKSKKVFDGFQITRYGSAPWMVEKNKIQLTVSNTRVREAVAVDANGYATGKPISLRHTAGAIKLNVPPNTLYVILH